jgi:hypothetical protein
VRASFARVFLTFWPIRDPDPQQLALRIARAKAQALAAKVRCVSIAKMDAQYRILSFAPV